MSSPPPPSPPLQPLLCVLSQREKDVEDHGTMCICAGHHVICFLTCRRSGQAFECVENWFEAQISGILLSISHVVCLHNFNYTGRPLRGLGIIGIKSRT